jgi:hypothetical protein
MLLQVGEKLSGGGCEAGFCWMCITGAYCCWSGFSTAAFSIVVDHAWCLVVCTIHGWTDGVKLGFRPYCEYKVVAVVVLAGVLTKCEECRQTAAAADHLQWCGGFVRLQVSVERLSTGGG